MAEFKFEVDKNFGDHVIEERDNTSKLTFNMVL